MDNLQKLFIRIRRGGNDAIAAAWDLSFLENERLATDAADEINWQPLPSPPETTP